MNKFTDEQLLKLRDYMNENCQTLVKEQRVSRVPYYPNQASMRSYCWTVIEIAGLGTIDLYFTGISSVLKINGVGVEEKRVRQFRFEDVERRLIKELNNQKVKESQKWFDEK